MWKEEAGQGSFEDGLGLGRAGSKNPGRRRLGPGRGSCFGFSGLGSRDLRGRPGLKPEDDPAAHFTSPLTASRSLERGSEGHLVVSSTEPMLGEHDESRPWAIAFCVSTTVDLRPDENFPPRKQTISGCFSLPLGRWALDGAPIYLRCGPADGRRKGGGRGTACARPTPRPRRQPQRFSGGLKRLQCAWVSLRRTIQRALSRTRMSKQCQPSP